jgi:Mce-associated membrane protein
MRTFTVILLGVLVAAAAVLVPTMWFDLRDLRAADAAGGEALAAAKQVAPDLLSYDYRSIEEDLARATRHTTGELTDHYKELTTSLVSKAKTQKTVQTVAVAGAGVERAARDRVEVLLFVDTVTVKEIPGQGEPRQQVTHNRARFVMVRQDGHWLVSALSTLLGTA